jgi:uncharacterized damage-inducible protein DinB
VDAESLLTFVRFHAWANDRLMTVAANLSDDEFRRPANLDHGSAFDTLRHLVDVDWSWREFCEGNDVGETYVWDRGLALDDLPALHAYCLDEDARLGAYVGSLDGAALAEPLAMSDDPNDVVPRWLIVAHVVNHGTQHRSEMARHLTESGARPASSTSWMRRKCSGQGAPDAP